MEASPLKEFCFSIPDHDIVRGHSGFPETIDDRLDYCRPGTEKRRSVGGDLDTDDIARLYQGRPGSSDAAFAGHRHHYVVHHPGYDRIIRPVIKNRVRAFGSNDDGSGRPGGWWAQGR